MSKLLINEQPYQLLPTLAIYVGLNEAIFLQQLHFQLNSKYMGKEVDGRKWVFNSISEWCQVFPFWGPNVIKRTIANLADDGLLDSRDDLNEKGYDRTKWYAINYDLLNKIKGPIPRVADKIEKRKKASSYRTPVQDEPTHDPGSSRTNGPVQNEPDNTIDYIPKRSLSSSPSEKKGQDEESEEEKVQPSLLSETQVDKEEEPKKKKPSFKESMVLLSEKNPEDIKIRDTKDGSKNKDDIVTQLSLRFSRFTGIKLTLIRNGGEYGELWKAPLLRMYDAVEGDMSRLAEVVTEVVRDMREDGLDIFSPKSVEKKFVSYVAANTPEQPAVSVPYRE